MSRESRDREAAGAYVLAVIADDEDAVDDALDRVDPLVLTSSVLEIAQRAIQALAHERGQSVEEVMSSLVIDT